MIHGFQSIHPDGLLNRTRDGHNIVTYEDFNYLTKSGELITVPAYSKSDGASVPRAFWNLFPPFGLYWLAALLHDWLYRCCGRPKDECDLLLLEAMESLGVSLIDRETIYKAVVHFGRSSFDEDRKEQRSVTK